jgi:hypothetical protein
VIMPPPGLNSNESWAAVAAATTTTAPAGTEHD